MITDEMVERACRAFSESRINYPGEDAKTPITEWFEIDAQDAVDFGVLKVPQWDKNSDIRAMQFEWYVSVVVKEAMRAALSAALSVEQPTPQQHSVGPQPCGIADPSTRDCPNMKEVGGGMDGERYRCDVCGKGYFLDYEEMK